MSSDLTSLVSGDETEAASGSIGQRLTQARDNADLSINELAGRLGVKNSTVTSWERNRSQPRGNRLITLAGLLNVSPTWLLTGFGEDPGFPSGTTTDEELGHIRASLLELRVQLSTMAERVDHLIDRLDTHTGE